MFYGDYDHTLDGKGRVSLPAKFREKISEQFYITKGLDQCLFVFNEDEWRKFEAKLKDLPLTNRNGRVFVRRFLSGMMETSLDKQGRMMINAKLREYAGLSKNVSIVGLGSRIEIWDQAAWQDYHDDEDNSLEFSAEALEELGI